MLRKFALASLAVVLVLATMTMASAKPNVADTTKKGSLLVFPKIETAFLDNSSSAVDTYVFIGNDNVVPVSIKCYWMDNNQTIEDFQFTMTPNQPVYFSAGFGRGTVDVPPFDGVGSLVCFAVNDAGDNQVKFNHLYGNAMIVFDDLAAMYNAYSFAAPGNPTGTPGQLVLDSTIYDACPQYLVTNFATAPNDVTNPILFNAYIYPDLTLWPCKQDLRQDRTPTCTKAKFDVWNENEIKFTSAYQCFKCFYEGFLDELGKTKAGFSGDTFDNTQRGPGFGWDKFVYSALHTHAARFRVQGIASTICDGKIRGCGSTKTVDTPLLGVMLYAVDSLFINTNNAKIVKPLTGFTPFGAGQDNTGLVQWDPAGPTPEAPAQ